PSSGNTLDLFTQMKLFANFHKTTLKDRGAFPAVEIVALATNGGAEVLGLSKEVGSLEVGKQADVVLVETKSVNMFPNFDPYAVLVYSGNASNVEMVYINGRCVVEKKQLVQQSLSSLQQNLQAEMSEFKKRAMELAD
ncbi:amidohydrolase family protein, partial [Carnobacterium sp.]